MLLLLFSGTKAGSPPVPTQLTVTTCCFQGGAFQYNAFQNCGFKGGWPNTIGKPQLKRRVPRKHLERLLALQRNTTFGRRWFEEFEAAQVQYAKAEADAAVKAAAREAREAAELVDARLHEEELADFQGALQETALALEVTKEVMRTKDIIASADHAYRIASEIKARFDEQDDEEMALLLQ